MTCGEMVKKINLLYISAFSQWGGSTISLLRRIERLDLGAFRVTVVVPTEGPMVKQYKNAGAGVKIVPFCVLLRFNGIGDFIKYVCGFLPSVLRLYRLMKGIDIDIVHSNDSIILVGGIAGKLAKLRTITHIRDDIKDPSWVVRLRNFIINIFSDRIFAVSKAVLDNFGIYGGDLSKSQVFYNGIDLDLFAPNLNNNGRANFALKREFSIPEEAKVVTHIARVDPNKGQEALVYAAELVLKVEPSVYFLLVGDNNTLRFQGYKDRVLKIIRERNLKDRVIFAGRRDNIQDIINISDVIVLNSIYEAHPGVICESSACGKPVVASKVGGIPELVKDGVTGCLVPPQDVKALTDSLLHLLSDTGCRENMGLMGRKYMEESFNINYLTRKLEIIYKDLLGP